MNQSKKERTTFGSLIQLGPQVEEAPMAPRMIATVRNGKPTASVREAIRSMFGVLIFVAP